MFGIRRFSAKGTVDNNGTLCMYTDYVHLHVENEKLRAVFEKQNNKLSERNKMLEYSMKAMQNTEKSNVAEICKLQEQNDKLIACLKRAYWVLNNPCPPSPYYFDYCPGDCCISCQKKYIAHGINS